jgi:hypothetical protein
MCNMPLIEIYWNTSFKNFSRIGIKFIKLLWTGDFNLNIYIWFERV